LSAIEQRILVADRPSGPLAGLLVADFSRILAGPYATMLLADLGAEVVKVESPAGDDTRSWQPPVRDGVATYYLGVNRNKRSVALDLKDAGDVALARELAGRADIVLENFRPGGLDRFELDYDSVAAGNPRVVYASISGFGTSEKGRVIPGYDLIVQAMSGLMSLTGSPDGQPFRAGISVFDVMAGLHVTIGILAALHSRDETGRGQHVEVNLMSSALSGLVNQSSAYVAGGVVPTRMGNSHPSLFPYEPLPCADGDLIITAGNNGQFRKLVEVLGVPELADDPRFSRNEDRTANRDLLRPLLVARLSTRSTMDWFHEITAAGVPCGPINSIDGGFAFAEEVGLDPVVEVGDGEAMVPSARNPITFSETPVDYRLPPPALDEHGEEIRAWLSGSLGLVTGASAPSSTGGGSGVPVVSTSSTDEHSGGSGLPVVSTSSTDEHSGGSGLPVVSTSSTDEHTEGSGVPVVSTSSTDGHGGGEGEERDE
jgi:crotonobetainyl-CoA:carnitine CoA-transferase CaiB-like acyl-CoA transferase